MALASDYDNLQIGALLRRRLRPDEAKTTIFESESKRYDPAVVSAFRFVIGEPLVEKVGGEFSVSAAKLEPGMVLSRDLVSRDGLLLLSADHLLDEKLIQQIIDFEKKNDGNLSIWVSQRRKSL